MIVRPIQAQELGLLGGHRDGGEARAVGTAAMADRGKSMPSGGAKVRERYQLPDEDDDSGSDSGSGAETDDEASSISDYPPPQLGQPPTRMVPTATSRDTTSQEHSCSAALVEKAETVATSQHQDVAEEESSLLEAALGTSSPLPTVQLPKLQASTMDRDSESSNGGNEPDVSCSGSEGGGGCRLSRDLQSEQAHLLQLPITGRLTAKHDNDHNSESESESSSVESVEDDLEDLSLQNKLHRPHRDRADHGGQQKDTPDSSSVASTTLTSTTNSYLYGENASDRVRHLVKRSLSKKKKQLQRQTRPKKETKAPTPAGRRSKKTNRNVIKHSVDVSIY